jgi:hypothetical protein
MTTYANTSSMRSVLSLASRSSELFIRPPLGRPLPLTSNIFPLFVYRVSPANHVELCNIYSFNSCECCRLVGAIMGTPADVVKVGSSPSLWTVKWWGLHQRI